jgi:hypothetical protein
MRASILAILAAGAVATAAPSQAQTYDPAFPYCVQVYHGMVDYYFDCTYRTLGSCQASASGRAASCVANPYYGGKQVVAKPVYRHKQQHSYHHHHH